MAPRAIRLQSELIMSISEYSPTPKVAAKNPSALTVTDGIETLYAVLMASSLSLPDERSRLYLVVISIA